MLFTRYVFGGSWPKKAGKKPDACRVSLARTVLVVASALVGLCVGVWLNNAPLTRWLQKTTSILLGVEVTLMLGLLSGFLLETHVSVESPYKGEIDFEEKGGGPFLEVYFALIGRLN